MYTAYTDGSCLGNPGPGGLGIIIMKDSEVLHRIAYGEEHTTNNIMELTAAISAILYIKEHCSTNEPIHIKTDSMYVINGSTKWMFNWKKKNWKDVKNVDLWKLMYEVVGTCTFEWVKGHSTDVYNNEVDEMARNAAEEIKRNLNANSNGRSTTG